MTEEETNIMQQINIPNTSKILQVGDTQKESSNHNPEIYYSEAKMPHMEKTFILPLFVLL